MAESEAVERRERGSGREGEFSDVIVSEEEGAKWEGLEEEDGMEYVYENVLRARDKKQE